MARRIHSAMRTVGAAVALLPAAPVQAQTCDVATIPMLVIVPINVRGQLTEKLTFGPGATGLDGEAVLDSALTVSREGAEARAEVFWWVRTRADTPIQVDMEGTQLCKDDTCVRVVESPADTGLLRPRLTPNRWQDTERLKPEALNEDGCVANLEVRIDSTLQIVGDFDERSGSLKASLMWARIIDPKEGTHGTPSGAEGNRVPEGGSDSVGVVIRIKKDDGGDPASRLDYLSVPDTEFPGEPTLDHKKIRKGICDTHGQLCECVGLKKLANMTCFTQSGRINFKKVDISVGP